MIDFRLIRGGSWYYRPWYCSSVFRNDFRSNFRLDDVGFRVCCSSEGNDHTLQLKEQTDD